MKTFFLLFFIVTYLFSIETVVILKSGENLKVELIDENEISIVFKNLDNGSVDIIGKEDIEKIVYLDTNGHIKNFSKTKQTKKIKRKKEKENHKSDPNMETEVSLNP
jgi:hypothetical protein